MLSKNYTTEKIIITIGLCSISLGYLLSIPSGQLNRIFISNDKMIIGQDFLFILKQNLLIGLGIIIGFISYNFFSIFLFIFNMFSLGFYLHHFQNKLGLFRSILLFMPHGIIEITWLTLLTIHTFKIFTSFKNALLTNFNDTSFLWKLISFKTLILFILIIITAIIESYLTPLLNNKF